jgi:acetyl-CoA synthetase
VDTWWQTETGGIMISNMAGISKSKASYATLPMPGVIPLLVGENGQPVPGSDAGKDGVFHAGAQGDPVAGNLCIRFPWPAIIRTTYGDHERCRLNYFSAYPDLYFTGDGALRDAEGNYRITGRVDDVLNVSGHRIGTAEVENAINMYPDVVESAVVGYPHDIKGRASMPL